MDRKVSETTKLAAEGNKETDRLFSAGKRQPEHKGLGTGQNDITTRRTNWGPDKQEYS